jgi:hypothetical protein
MVKVDTITGETKIRKDMVWYNAKGQKCKPPSKPKVYCIDCEYVGSDGDWGRPTEWCCKVVGVKDNPMEEEYVHANPEKDNKKNNCQYYKKRLTLWQRIFNNV